MLESFPDFNVLYHPIWHLKVQNTLSLGNFKAGGVRGITVMAKSGVNRTYSGEQIDIKDKSEHNENVSNRP